MNDEWVSAIILGVRSWFKRWVHKDLLSDSCIFTGLSTILWYKVLARCWDHSLGIPIFLNHKPNRLLRFIICPACSIVLEQQKTKQDTDLLQWSYRHFLLLLDPVGLRVDCKRREDKGHRYSLFTYYKSIFAVNAGFGKCPNTTFMRPEAMSCFHCLRDHSTARFPWWKRSENICRPPGGNSTPRWETSQHWSPAYFRRYAHVWKNPWPFATCHGRNTELCIVSPSPPCMSLYFSSAFLKYTLMWSSKE